jgi:hypothetical protein
MISSDELPLVFINISHPFRTCACVIRNQRGNYLLPVRGCRNFCFLLPKERVVLKVPEGLFRQGNLWRGDFVHVPDALGGAGVTKF